MTRLTHIAPWSVVTLLALIALMFATTKLVVANDDVVNIYSARHYDTDRALYERFTELTGVEINLIEGDSNALIERIQTEGEFSPADILITVDAGNLWRADQLGIFRGTETDVLSSRITDNLRHPDGHWFGLSKRARVIVYNKSNGLPEDIEDYEDLADPSLHGMVCMRSSSNIYNLSLLGSMIAHDGVDDAQVWADGVVANFAREPQGNDTAQLRAVAAGECGITIANTYYIGRLLASEDPADQAVMDELVVLFPNQSSRGTHINISGAGITRYAPNPDNAKRFLEYLTSEFAQRLFAEGNNEYPVIGPATGPVAALGEFNEDQLNANALGENQAEAVRVFDRAGWH